MCVCVRVWRDDRSEESSSDDSDNDCELWFEQRRRIKDSIRAGGSVQLAILSPRYHSRANYVYI